ncbi:hypothetical protein IPZ61_02660 [Streptomyces sioyaensis]|uniref:trypsin-like serine peptidase n=1 Tax=Streptomyces sioyaensis TaxID=67364 RepID=UPI001F1D52A7|nr:hypothetical protein [Streptomyces sioyaensis]MCF3172234.1 hypothetical protein [Streptomyces sioyaensis]
MISRHRTTFRFGLGGSLIAVLALWVPQSAAGAAEPERSAAPPSAAAGGATASAEADAASYWTPERRAAAKATPLPGLSAREIQRVIRESATSSRLGRLSAPPTAPANKAATRGGSKAGGAVNKARPWGKAGKQPALTTGRLFYRLPDGSGHTCSASVIHASNKNTLWTAGHCVHPGGGGDGKFYDPDYMTFAPDDDGGRAPHGLWEAAYINTTKGWADDRDFAQDVAGVEVRPQSDRGDIQEFTGSQGYHFGYGQDFSDVTFLGYPAAGNGRSFPGDRLTYCRDNTEDASGWWWDERLQMVCDMGQGSSGGPWIDDLNGDGQGYIVGAMSHVYDPDPNDPDNAWSDSHGFSSNHGDGAINVYEDVANH